MAITTTNSATDINDDGVADILTTATTSTVDVDGDGDIDLITTTVTTTSDVDADGEVDFVTTTVTTTSDLDGDGEFSTNTVTNFETICFLTGTNIFTENGYVPVEELAIGDVVKTADGELKPIKWIGYQTHQPTQVKDTLGSNPVLIKAGALGDNLPSRDLYVSPNHSLLVDGLLINAGALTNNVSIVTIQPTETFVYYHVELDNHALLIAEGTSAESYLPQKEDRMGYDNGAEYEQLYPQGSKLMLWPMDYPRISSKGKVPSYVRKRLENIAADLYGVPVAEAM